MRSSRSMATRALFAALLVSMVAGCGDDSEPSGVIVDPDDEAASLFDPNTVRTYDILLSEENLAILDNAPAEEQYVPGAIVIDGVTYDNVGVRYKGGVGSWARCLEDSGGNIIDLTQTELTGAKSCYKLSMKVKFNEYDPERRFKGLRRLQFHAMITDYTYLRERLAFAIYREMGVVAPRAAHARLKVNGQLIGLVLLVEQIDGSFTRTHFTEGGEGNLYKEIWPQWQTAEPYLAALKTNEDENPSVEKMVRLASELAEANGKGESWKVVARWFDVDRLMRIVATEWGIGDDDGIYLWYCWDPNNPNTDICTNHNYRFYEEVKRDRMWLIPWDMEYTFHAQGNLIEPLTTAWDDMGPPCEIDRSTGIFGRIPPTCDPLLRGLTHYQKEYVERLQELVDGPFRKEAIDAKLDAWTAQIRPYIEEEISVWGDQARTLDEWEYGVDALRRSIDKLREDDMADLAARKARLGMP